MRLIGVGLVACMIVCRHVDDVSGGLAVLQCGSDIEGYATGRTVNFKVPISEAFRSKVKSAIFRKDFWAKMLAKTGLRFKSAIFRSILITETEKEKPSNKRNIYYALAIYAWRNLRAGVSLGLVFFLGIGHPLGPFGTGFGGGVMPRRGFAVLTTAVSNGIMLQKN